MRVGICDDNNQARRMVSGWLKTRPEVAERNIHEFQCGEALLEHLRRSVLDIVFLDCKMDGIRGRWVQSGWHGDADVMAAKYL